MMKNIHHKKSYEAEKGITLIALIITIIVLLILAGVSIAMLTGENNILNRAQSVNFSQSQAELYEKMSLSIMESRMDLVTQHTLDAVVSLAVANGYIVLDGTKYELIDELIDETITSTNLNEYVPENWTEVTVLDVETGANVRLVDERNGNIRIEIGDRIDIANRRTITIELEEKENDEGFADIYISAKLVEEPSKTNSKITSIIGPDGKAIEEIEIKEEDNGDFSATAVYTAETNGKHTFKAVEANGGTATESIQITKAAFEEIQVTVEPLHEWTTEVLVTVEYDTVINPETQAQISRDGTNWEYARNTKEEIILTENGTIKARYNVNGREYGEKEIVVSNIDTDNPTVPVFSIENISADKFYVNITTPSTDQSGIDRYEVYVYKNGEQEKVVTLQFNELTTTVIADANQMTIYNVDTTIKDADNEDMTIPGGFGIPVDIDEYSVKIVVYDGAGKSSETDTKIAIEKTEDPLEDRDSIEEGFVIADAEGNQFVWVVADFNINTAAANLKNVESGGIYESTAKSTYTEPKYLTSVSYGDESPYNTIGLTENILVEEFEQMQASVVKRGGFYVSRYELSYGENGTAESKAGVVAARASHTETMYWYGLYALAKTYTNGNITSTMMANSQYDILLEWITEEEIEASENNNSYTVTGIKSTDKIRSIYDLNGCGQEWTTGGYITHGRVARGGYYTIGSASTVKDYSVMQSVYYFGTRATLIW